MGIGKLSSFAGSSVALNWYTQFSGQLEGRISDRPFGHESTASWFF